MTCSPKGDPGNDVDNVKDRGVAAAECSRILGAPLVSAENTPSPKPTAVLAKDFIVWSLAADSAKGGWLAVGTSRGVLLYKASNFSVENDGQEEEDTASK